MAAHLVRRETLAVQAYDGLRHKILYHELPPGTRIHEKELADELGVSITPVREALSRLERDGLVIRKPWVGTVVTEFTEIEMSTLHDVRAMLETTALRQASPHITSKDIETLLELQEQMRALTEAGADVSEIDRINHQFHHFFVETANNRWLSRVLGNLQDVLFMLRYPITRLRRDNRSYQEHVAVLHALRDGDPERAVALMERHISRVKQDVLAYYRSRLEGSRGDPAEGSRQLTRGGAQATAGDGR